MDKAKNLWIGTRLGGLTRYNPETGIWTTFKHDANDARSISNDEVLCIFEDSQSRLWVGTENGLNLFNQSTQDFTTYLVDEHNPNSLAAKAVLDIIEDDKGWIWVGTWAGGLHLMMEDGDGIVDNNNFRIFSPNTNKGSSNIWKIYQDDDGRYWLGSYGGGLFIMNLPGNASNQVDAQTGNFLITIILLNQTNPTAFLRIELRIY